MEKLIGGKATAAWIIGERMFIYSGAEGLHADGCDM